MAVLGLRCCARAFSSCGKWGPLFITVRGPLTIAASLVAVYFYLFIFWPRCAACEIFVPPPGIELGPSAVETQSPNHWPAREFPECYTFKWLLLCYVNFTSTK